MSLRKQVVIALLLGLLVGVVAMALLATSADAAQAVASGTYLGGLTTPVMMGPPG